MKKTYPNSSTLTDAQLRIEIDKCEYCAEKPCKAACPCDCSPADFIMAARLGAPSDYRRATAEIMSMNPLGGVCGQVCPDRFCMAACSHARVDAPLNIPAIQATIVAKARALDVMPAFGKVKANGKRVAIVGGGPAGLAAAACLGQHGYAAHIYELRDEPGGMCQLIPGHRLDRSMLEDAIHKARARGVKISGSRFYVLKGAGARLQRALNSAQLCGSELIFIIADESNPGVTHRLDDVRRKEGSAGGVVDNVGCHVGIAGTAVWVFQKRPVSMVPPQNLPLQLFRGA